MLFPFEEYRFASKLLKRQQQLQTALFRAEASHLPEGITEVYRRALTRLSQPAVAFVRFRSYG